MTENYSTEVLVNKLLKVMPAFLRKVKSVPPHKQSDVLQPDIAQIVASTARQDPAFRISDIPWNRLTNMVLEKYSEVCSPEEYIAIKAFMERQN